MKRDCRRDGELSPEGLTHCRSSRSSPAVWPQRGLGDPRPGIPTFTSPGVSSRPKAQKLLPSSPPAVPAENVSLLGGWVLATTVGQHCGRLPRSPLRSADRVEVATVANRLRTVTDGQGYFTFSLFCLEFMLTKRKKKKRQKRFPGNWELFVVFHEMPERHKISFSFNPEAITPPEAHQQAKSGISKCESSPKTDKEKTENGYSTSSEKAQSHIYK